MENNKINQKIDAALSSLDGIQRAEADNALFDGILQKLDEKKIKVRQIVPMRTVWLAAASMALVVAMNVALLVSSGQNEGNTEGVHSAAATEIARTYLNLSP